MVFRFGVICLFQGILSRLRPKGRSPSLKGRLGSDTLYLFQAFEDILALLAVDPRHVSAKRASRDAAEHHSFHQRVEAGHRECQWFWRRQRGGARAPRNDEQTALRRNRRPPASPGDRGSALAVVRSLLLLNRSLGRVGSYLAWGCWRDRTQSFQRAFHRSTDSEVRISLVLLWERPGFRCPG